MDAKALGLRELLAFGELDADRGQHRAPVTDVGAGDGGFITRLGDRTIGPVAREYVLDAQGDPT
jgi:hypothetical protein